MKIILLVLDLLIIGMFFFVLFYLDKTSDILIMIGLLIPFSYALLYATLDEFKLVNKKILKKYYR